MNIHPFSLVFPEATPEEFQALKVSMNQHGQREPIVILGGEILDGRTRYQAAHELKIPPQFRQYDPIKDGPDPMAWVIDRNLHRRHLTVGQRAALAVTLEQMIKAQREAAAAKNAPPAKTTPVGPAAIGDEDEDLDIGYASGAWKPGDPSPPDSGKPRAREEAAKQAGVSEGSVAKAKDLAANDPQRFDAVKQGKTTLDAASKASKEERASEEPPLANAGQIVNPYRAECADMIAPNLGNKFADAVRAATILKEGELKEFMKLTLSDQSQIAKLVATGWKVKPAVKFAKGIFEQDDTLRELINLATMRGGNAVARLAGYTLLAVDDQTLAMTEWTMTRHKIEEVQAKQAKPETAAHKPVSNTVGDAIEAAADGGKPKSKAMQKAEENAAKVTAAADARKAKNPSLHATVEKIAAKNRKTGKK